MILGPTIKRLRQERGWTSKTLGARSRVTSETIRKIETGHCNFTMYTLTALASGFGMKASKLVKICEGDQKP